MTCLTDPWNSDELDRSTMIMYRTAGVVNNVGYDFFVDFIPDMPMGY